MNSSVPYAGRLLACQQFSISSSLLTLLQPHMKKCDCAPTGIFLPFVPYTSHGGCIQILWAK